ncbi:MAG: glycerate kinase [Lachnospiraceae bacterium]|nr:glycerate kinase [Lachnospiraceae bacterium]
MKIVAAIDSFKGSMTSIDAGDAAALGIQRACPTAEVVVRPLADGGEGTVEAVIEGMQGRRQVVTVTGPLGKPVDCVYGMIPEINTAVIEMSGAAGITLVEREELNPLEATTYGVGEVIRDAVNRGCRRFIVGIGGSATNDGGVGMLQALGFDFLDEDGNQIEKGAKGLRTLAKISTEHVMPELKECEFMVACDVTNPLLGENGCSAVFGPQKGATEKMVQEMDQLLSHYVSLSEEFCKEQIRNYEEGAYLIKEVDEAYPGSGAAGGMGFAFRTFLNATLKPGIDIVLEETRLEDYIKDADLVITGEGMLDFQTAMGKAPIGVAKLAKKHGKPVIAFAGGVTKDAATCNDAGIDAFFPIVRGVTTLEDAMKPENARGNLADTAEQVMRVIGCSKEL